MGKKVRKSHGKRKPPIPKVSHTPDKGTSVRNTHKDTLFRFIFQDKKKLLQLYNALNNSDYEDENLLEITTIENVIYFGVKNDLSFLVDMSLYLMEHQGSWNGNMPLRGLLYFARLYRSYAGDGLYSSKTVLLPVPYYVVFYNGTSARPEREILKLSDAFGIQSFSQGETQKNTAFLPPPALECQALMLNINYGNNREFMEKCRPLMEYSRFVHEIRENIRGGRLPEEAAELAVKTCLAQGILTDVLKEHRREVVAMFLEDYDQEVHYRIMRRDAHEDGYSEGYSEGRESMLKDQVKKKLKKGKTVSQITVELEEMEDNIQRVVDEIQKAEL